MERGPGPRPRCRAPARILGRGAFLHTDSLGMLPARSNESSRRLPDWMQAQGPNKAKKLQEKIGHERREAGRWRGRTSEACRLPATKCCTTGEGQSDETPRAKAGITVAAPLRWLKAHCIIITMVRVVFQDGSAVTVSMGLRRGQAQCSAAASSCPQPGFKIAKRTAGMFRVASRGNC